MEQKHDYTHYSLEEFGQDHFSLLMYVEVRCVDHRGKLDMRHLAVNTDRHPFVIRHDLQMMPENDKIEIRLADGKIAKDYDEVDCLEDLEHHGIVLNKGTDLNRIYEMTDFGFRIAHDLRRWKACGRKIAHYKYEEKRISYVYKFL